MYALDITTRERLIKKAKEFNSFEDYKNWLEWEDWMQTYCDETSEGEELTEREIDTIDRVIAEIFKASREDD